MIFYLYNVMTVLIIQYNLILIDKIYVLKKIL